MTMGDENTILKRRSESVHRKSILKLNNEIDISQQSSHIFSDMMGPVASTYVSHTGLFQTEKELVDRYFSLPMGQYGNQEFFVALALCHESSSHLSDDITIENKNLFMFE